jgi:hypothetical protein
VLTTPGVDATRVYTDKVSGTSTRQQRPGLAALLDCARMAMPSSWSVSDRLARNAAEVMTTIRDLGERRIVLRSLREGAGHGCISQGGSAQPGQVFSLPLTSRARRTSQWIHVLHSSQPLPQWTHSQSSAGRWPDSRTKFEICQPPPPLR